MPTDRYSYEGEVIMMDHDVVVREQMAEKYLLEELDPEVREQFEEHFFDCQECAEDIRAGSEFVAHSKIILAEEPKPAIVAAPGRVVVPALGDTRRGWFSSFRAGFRPAFAIPVMAALLAVIGYQNLVTYPQLEAAQRQPQLLPFASVTLQTWGAGGAPLMVRQGRDFILNVRIPPDPQVTYVRYLADLYNPAGKREWSLAIPAVQGQDRWAVKVPGAKRESGIYKLTVRGFTAVEESKDLGSTSFELEIQN